MQARQDVTVDLAEESYKREPLITGLQPTLVLAHPGAELPSLKAAVLKISAIEPHIRVYTVF
jgi:hypothetical protein